METEKKIEVRHLKPQIIQGKKFKIKTDKAFITEAFWHIRGVQGKRDTTIAKCAES